MADDPSLAIVAKGVVASLDEAEIIEGAASGSAGDGEATGVFCTEDSGFAVSVGRTIGDCLFGVVGSDVFSRGNRGEGAAAPGRRDGTVLLRCTFPLGDVGVPTRGVTGVGPFSDRLLCLLETDTLRRRLFHLPSILVLAPEVERCTTVRDLLGVTGEPGTLPGLGAPDWTSLTVS